MQIGMGWYRDNPRQPLTETVREAASWYLHKYGQQATECWLNPADADGLPEWIGPIRLVRCRQVLRDNLWLGVGQSDN